MPVVCLYSSRDLTFGRSLFILSSFSSRREFQRSSRATESSNCGGVDISGEISTKLRLDVVEEEESILDMRWRGRRLAVGSGSIGEDSSGDGKHMPVTPAVVAGVTGEASRLEMGFVADTGDTTIRLG